MDQAEALQKLQQTEYTMLCSIADYLSDNNIEWFLEAGSALGAVRHNGFIPWDDDIDIAMFRDEYDRFISLAQNGLPDGLSLHTFSDSEGMACLFAKIYLDGTSFETSESRDAGCNQGIFIDVFPFDQLPLNKRKRRKQIRRAQFWKNVSYLYHSSRISVLPHGLLGFLLRSACIVIHRCLRIVMTREAIKHHFDSAVNQEYGVSSDEWGCFSAPNVVSYPREVLTPPVPALFLDRVFPVPARPEEYLTIKYGNWTDLPSEDERHTHLPQLIVFPDGSTWNAA